MNWNWNNLETTEQLQQIVDASFKNPQLIFKHSTRCPVSSLAKNRLEKKVAPETVDFYYLDLIKYRKLSNQIAEDFGVHHESPQVLLLENGTCTYHDSHSAITMEDIEEAAGKNDQN